MNDKLILPEWPYAYASPASEIKLGGIHIIGFEFDGTVCFRKGASRGPDAFRRVSEGIESYSPYLNVDIDEDRIPLFDLGNLRRDREAQENAYPSLNKSFNEILEGIDLNRQKSRLITLGGEHSVSLAPIEKYLADFPDLVVIHLDAHADLRDGYLGNYYSHASIIRRALDRFSDGHELIQYGIRSGTREEYKWMDENKTISRSRKDFMDKVRNLDDDRPIYLTLDLDFFDPSFVPGTGTPEAGGEDFHSYVGLLKVLKDKNFVGGDIVELAPDIDPTDNSSVFATKVLREMICAIFLSGKRNEVSP